MLNISQESISAYIDQSQYKSYRKLLRRSNSQVLIKMLLVFLLLTIVGMFLPWTQNIRSKGYVTTLNPFDKPQNIQSLIGGKIDQWYVKEGDVVLVGDTIAIITEAKEEYLDPDLLSNTGVQMKAKENSVEAYAVKKKFLMEQLTALAANNASKLEQIRIKQEQLDLKIGTEKLNLAAAETYETNAANQLARMTEMHSKGIKSLTDLEQKRLSNQEAVAKKLSVINKLNEYTNDKSNLLREIEIATTDYEQKVAKLESEIRTVDSYRFSLQGESNKLQSKINQIQQRQDAYIIKSPINGRVTKVLKNGIGEYIKSQESIATIVPTSFQKAVELYVEPNDMPLIQEGKKVRIQFDGWPAMVFSGWPDNSFGTFGGRLFAIDNDISSNGRYRILVVEEPSDKPWPDLIRIGSGAQGLLLLNDVKIYYEIWRKLNGFPPDFYNENKIDPVKNKAPLRKFK